MLNLYGFAGAFLSILGFNGLCFFESFVASCGNSLDLAENIIDYPYMELDKIVSEDVNWFCRFLVACFYYWKSK